MVEKEKLVGVYLAQVDQHLDTNIGSVLWSRSLDRYKGECGVGK
jgi:hypothetical protein